MKTKLLLLIIISILFCSGCGGWFQRGSTTIPEFNITKDINEAQKTINQSTTIIDKSTNSIIKETVKIDEETTQVKDKIPKEIKPDVNPHLNNISESSNIIKKDTLEINRATANLSSANSLLENAEQKAIVTEGTLNKIIRERDNAINAQKRAEEARDSALHKAVRWLILASIVASAGLGVFGFMYESKLSLTLSATCIVIMSVAIFIETYFIVVVIFGGIVLIGLIGALVWNIIIQKRAFSEIVNTVEIAQDNLSEEAKNKIFGGEGEQGLMKKVQSKETMELVKKEKSKLGSLWEYAKDKANGNNEVNENSEN